MELMSSRDVQKYLKKNDLVILPIGCFEMHGPDIPLGCDTFLDWSMALLLAREWKCITMPPVYYTFPGASGPWPGTIDIPVKITQEYVTAIIYALLKDRFKRIVLLGSHGPLGFVLECVIRDVFQSTGNSIVYLSPHERLSELTKKAGIEAGEDGHVLAAMKILGLHGAYDPASKVDKPKEAPFKTLVKLNDECRATIPWTYTRDYQHTGIHKKLKMSDADSIVKVMKKAAKSFKDMPKLFAQYQKEMKDLYKRKPWEKETIWTKTK
jgi:creatinine amidohydrolase/Fe(II)-dependent formamide hydrolase-like protein